jgi:hypothetical protein
MEVHQTYLVASFAFSISSEKISREDEKGEGEVCSLVGIMSKITAWSLWEALVYSQT